MAFPDESPDEGDADATLTVSSANGTTASAMTAGSLTTLAVGVADATAGVIDSAATGTAAVAVFHATSASHVLDSEGYASGDQPVLISIDNYNAGTQQTSGESHASPVEEGSAAVVPTSVIALPVSRIRDNVSRAIRRGNNTSLSSASEDSQSSSSEEGAVGGVTKRSCCKLVEKNVSKDHLSSGNKRMSVDLSSVLCCICYERYKDSACLPCGHMGCYPCIQQWLLFSDPLSICHICRKKVESVQTPIVLCNFSFKPRFTNY